MTTNLEMIFKGEHKVRVVVDQFGAPKWVAADVCEALGIRNPRDTILKVLDPDERGVDSIYTPGGPQKMGVINESGLYGLIFKSRKKKAVEFRKWVTGVVLPEIRKQGSFNGMAALEGLLEQQNQILLRQEQDRKFWLTRDTETCDRLNMQATQIERLQAELAGVRQPKPIGRQTAREILCRIRDLAWRKMDRDSSTHGMNREERRNEWMRKRKRTEAKLRRAIDYPMDTGNSFAALPSDRLGTLQVRLNTMEKEESQKSARDAKKAAENDQQKLFVLPGATPSTV